MRGLVWTLFDRIGFSVSFVCAIHCLAMPILLPLVPILAGTFWVSESTEAYVMVATILIAAPALFRGYLLHRKFRVPAIFILGLLFPLIRPEAHTHEHIHLHGDDILHFTLAALGGFSLAMGHWLNLRFCKSCPSCTDHNKPCH